MKDTPTSLFGHEEDVSTQEHFPTKRRRTGILTFKEIGREGMVKGIVHMPSFLSADHSPTPICTIPRLRFKSSSSEDSGDLHKSGSTDTISDDSSEERKRRLELLRKNDISETDLPMEVPHPECEGEFEFFDPF
eukprot:TRINITY_DN5399_c0_g1_i1.p1 TRINITY_DN5399_c0_g1~~TRINITY_DN5399_c0_g1_i1.p1  ORF type:complete len:134 (-),score=28.17 TRINITY_DN5399_c0_g1_i1:448-849(-)